MELSSSPERPPADALTAAVSGPLAAAEASLSAHSRSIPSGRDFHFYNSFDPFRSHSKQILSSSQSLLCRLSSVANRCPPPPDDPEDALHWLSDLNDDLLERLSASLDHFDAERSRLEGSAREGAMEDGGFEVVYGKKDRKKKNKKQQRTDGGFSEENGEEGKVGAKVLVRDKKIGEVRARVPFHIPSIPRPQDEFNIRVDNSNQPFKHVWLERSDNGTRFVHPLEKLSVRDFVDRSVAEHEPVKPRSLEDTPFKLVEGLKELKEVAIKLRDATEFAIDLEHNQYRSFLGLTCLMQISTRTEDFVVDTLKLRVHVGPYLREIFKDPSKRKVMHGADRDILWLQRDFGIYICNLFDTGQASRVLKLERNSLAYLLHHYCGVTLNKEYQNADWRLRPIPDEMLKYAREDTHYLLYLYDLMRQELLAALTYTENGDALMEVYERSYDVCMQLYEKELLTDTSYLYIYGYLKGTSTNGLNYMRVPYLTQGVGVLTGFSDAKWARDLDNCSSVTGLREADFSSEQLAVVAALCEWRDNVARAEDESTGYVLPNKALLEIARRLPVAPNKLRRLVKSKHPFVERYLGLVVSIIKCAINNAPTFESVLEQLKKERSETEAKRDDADKEPDSNEINSEASLLEDAACVDTTKKVQSLPDSSGPVDCLCSKTSQHICNENAADNCKAAESLSNRSLSQLKLTALNSIPGCAVEGHASNLSTSPKLNTGVNIASVQTLKKPSGAFGALLGSSSSKRRPNPLSVKSSEQEVAQIKLEQIKSSVSLPFFSFSGVTVANAMESLGPLQFQPSETQQESDMQPNIAECEEIIPLGDESDDSHQSMGTPETANSPKDSTQQMQHLKGAESIKPVSDVEVNVESPSLAELSSSLEKSFTSLNQSRSSSADNIKPRKPRSPLKLEPFDYAAARKQTSFGHDQAGEAGEELGHKSGRGSRGERKGTAQGPSRGETTRVGFQQPWRRQAFPPSGNRNATFR